MGHGFVATGLITLSLVGSVFPAVLAANAGTKVMPCVFTNCPSLEKPLDLYVKNLGYRTFMDCTGLKHIHLHNGLIELGYSAFKNCSSLEDIYDRAHRMLGSVTIPAQRQ